MFLLTCRYVMCHTSSVEGLMLKCLSRVVGLLIVNIINPKDEHLR